MKNWPIWILCLLAFHAPDNSMLYLQSSHIVGVRPDGHNRFVHLQRNAHAVIYASTGNFAVAETASEVNKKLEDCEADHAPAR